MKYVYVLQSLSETDHFYTGIMTTWKPASPRTTPAL